MWLLNTSMKVFDPNRARYTKKIGKFKICELCNELNIRKQSCRNLESDKWRVFVNKYPYLDGNVMVIPKRHITRVEKLTKDEWSELYLVLGKTMKVLEKIFDTKDFNINMNIGKYAGASLNHLHWQVVPRSYGPDNAMNVFADLRAIKVSPWELKKKIENMAIFGMVQTSVTYIYRLLPKTGGL